MFIFNKKSNYKDLISAFDSFLHAAINYRGVLEENRVSCAVSTSFTVVNKVRSTVSQILDQKFDSANKNSRKIFSRLWDRLESIYYHCDYSCAYSTGMRMGKDNERGALNIGVNERLEELNEAIEKYEYLFSEMKKILSAG